MKLTKLEIQNYRSIQSGEVTPGPLTCLVGRNNHGKSNVLYALRYLYGQDSDRSDQIHYDRNPSNEVLVKAHFEISDGDLARLKLQDKVSNVREAIRDNHIVFARSSTHRDLQIVVRVPEDERLEPQCFEQRTKELYQDRTRFEESVAKEFPEILPYRPEGKLTQKACREALAKFLASNPPDLKWRDTLRPVPTGLPADIVSNLLPRIIFLPAVKDANEVTKTTASQEMGKLLAEVGEALTDSYKEELQEALQIVSQKLNRPAEGPDGRDEVIKAVEARLQQYISEAFTSSSLRLDFPTPELKVMFEEAKVWIKEEGGIETLPSGSGHGIQRMLIFSLFRTLADVRSGLLKTSSLRQGKEQEGTKPDEEKTTLVPQPTIFLFEDAELYLHPNAQRLLLAALTQLAKLGSQIVMSTHSPFMIDSANIDHVHLIRKSTKATNIELLANLGGSKEKDIWRILAVQNAAEFLFSEHVLLVEGESDRIAISAMAEALNKDWDFRRKNIGVIAVGGKTAFKMFRDGLRKIGIRVSIVTDLDACLDVIGDLISSVVKPLYQQLHQLLDQKLSTLPDFEGVSKGTVHKVKDSTSWRGTFEELAALSDSIKCGKKPDESGVSALDRILSFGKAQGKKAVLDRKDPQIEEVLDLLLLKCADEGIYVLKRGRIENYYPEVIPRDKIQGALALRGNVSKGDVLNMCGELGVNKAREKDIVYYLSKIFSA